MGYATEAARALILHAFETGGFAYLTVGHFSDNPASARVIAKFGFDLPRARRCATARRAGQQGALPDLPARTGPTALAGFFSGEGFEADRAKP